MQQHINPWWFCHLKNNFKPTIFFKKIKITNYRSQYQEHNRKSTIWANSQKMWNKTRNKALKRSNTFKKERAYVKRGIQWRITKSDVTISFCILKEFFFFCAFARLCILIGDDMKMRSEVEDAFFLLGRNIKNCSWPRPAKTHKKSQAFRVSSKFWIFALFHVSYQNFLICLIYIYIIFNLS